MCPLLIAIDSLIWNRIELTSIKRHGSMSRPNPRVTRSRRKFSVTLSLSLSLHARLQKLRRTKIFSSQQSFKSYLCSIDSRFFTSLCFEILMTKNIQKKKKQKRLGILSCCIQDCFILLCVFDWQN